MNMERSYQVTANQAKDLRNFDIPEAKIQALNKKQASELLTQLIERARSNPRKKPPSNENKGMDSISEVQGNLSDATNIVMQQFGLKDRSELREVHVALIQETARQIYGLRYWIGKSNGYLELNGD
jgi:ribonuclease D